MPAPTRCPSCSAALAPGAAWCSLCHADLRPQLEVRRSQDVVPGAPAAHGAATAVATRPAAVDAPVDVDVDLPSLDGSPSADPSLDPALVAPAGRGRHSRSADGSPPAPAPRPASGRHARGHGPRRQTRTEVALTEGLDVDPAGLEPEEVDALADQMLTRLAVSETRPRLLDPDDVPGGKPAFIAGAALGVVLVLTFLFTLFGFLLGRG